MPVYKYITFEEARRALWNFAPDTAYFNQLAVLWDIADKLCLTNYPQGVFKYKSIIEANRQRKKWEVDHAKLMRLKRDRI